MSNIPVDPERNPKWTGGEILRTLMLAIVLAVMAWVGESINQLRSASSDQSKAQAVMQAKFDDMQQSLKPLGEAFPSLSREVDKHDVQLQDHERRITALEQLKGLKR